MKNARNLTFLIFSLIILASMTAAFAGQATLPLMNAEGITAPSLLSDLPRSLNSNDGTTKLTLMTNVVHSITQNKRLKNEDVDAACSTIRNLLSEHPINSDKDAILFILNGVSTLKTISTNEYANELIVAKEADVEFQKERRKRPGSLSIVSRYRGPNIRKLENKWNPIFEHNSNCSRLRDQLIKTFALTVSSLKRTMPQNEFAALYESINRMTDLTADEKNHLLNIPTHTIELETRLNKDKHEVLESLEAR